MSDDGYDDWADDEGLDDDGDPCDHCGPSCEHWGGDGICELAIEQYANEHEEYYHHYVTEGVHCPVCGAILTEYRVPVDEIWLWPGDFYNPMIALDIYAVYDAPKGIVHRHDQVYHIWVGKGEFRSEKLVRLLGKGKVVDITAPGPEVQPATDDPDALPF